MSINAELAKLKNYIETIDDAMKNLKSIMIKQGFNIKDGDGLQELTMYANRHKVGYFNIGLNYSSDKFYLGIGKLTTNEMGYKIVDKTSVSGNNKKSCLVHLVNDEGYYELCFTSLNSALSQYVFTYDDGSRSGTATVSVPNKINVSVF